MSAMPHVRHVHARRQGRSPQRLKRARASAVALIAALVSAVLAAAPASAAECADGVDACNADVAFTWGVPFLATDADSDGLPDPGDVVVYRFSVDPVRAAVESASVDDFDLGSAFDFTFVAGGARLVVESWMLDSDSSGPLFSSVSTGTVHWSTQDFTGPDIIFASGVLEVPPPPVFYTKVTTLEVIVDETHGDTTDGKPAEGDRVRYAVNMPIDVHGGLEAVWFVTSPAPFLSIGTDHATLATEWIRVTQAHLLAGEVTLPAMSLRWVFWDGTEYTETYAPGPVETEPIDASFDADVTLQWRDATRTATRALGEAQVGDVIDFTFELENLGNLTLDYIRVLPVTPMQSLYFASWTWDGNLAPGGSLPNEVLTADALSSDPAESGLFDPAYVTAADIARGYIDLEFEIRAAPDEASYDDDPSAATAVITQRVLLREFVTDVTWTVELELLDTNGDGVGQPGEQIRRTLTVANGADSEQGIEIDKVWSTGVPAEEAVNESPILAGRVVNPGESAAESVVFDITGAGIPASAFALRLYGLIDEAARTLSDAADEIPLGPYVAPTTMLDVSHVYADTNGDGNLSVGDTVTFTATVENTDDYPLNGIVLSDAASDVLGTLPTDTTLAGGANLTWDVVHVLTLADFRRGSLAYDVTLDADGLTQLHDAEVLTAINFAAIEAELDPHFEGLIAVCVDGAEVTELMQGDSFTVHEGDCTGPQLGPDDKIYVFSTPVFLGNGHVALVMPTDLPPGPHKVAAYSEAAQIIGWVPLDVIAAPTPAVVTPVVTDAEVDAMPVTGPDGSTWTITWIALLALVLGGAAVALPRRREGGR